MKKRSERQRWVEVCRVDEPDVNNANGYAKQQHVKARAVIEAFAKVGRVVRAEPGNYGALIYKARRG